MEPQQIARPMSFACPAAYAMGPLTLHEPLQRALALLENRFARDGIAVHMTVPSAWHCLRGSGDRLVQVFLNILINAWQAMPDGGWLLIDLGMATSQTIRLVFRDTGHGMTATQLTRACEPFYTTRNGKASGLGLAICRQIIAAHNGSIELQSMPGAGTTVILTFATTTGPRSHGHP